jgi:hypothetical protein
MSAAGRQVAAVDDEFGCDFAEIGEHRVEGAAVAVDVRYNRDSHSGMEAASNRRE